MPIHPVTCYDTDRSLMLEMARREESRSLLYRGQAYTLARLEREPKIFPLPPWNAVLWREMQATGEKTQTRIDDGRAIETAQKQSKRR